jgi:hypothetical protein
MTVVVAHHSTVQHTVEILDDAAGKLLAGAGSKNVQIVDPKKSWDGPVMSFSFTGKMGFISVPLAGTASVDDANVTVNCELPAMVRNFVGEEKVRALVAEKIQSLVTPSA